MASIYNYQENLTIVYFWVVICIDKWKGTLTMTY